MTTPAPLPVCLGAPSPGGLALPPATPTRSQMYGPRGVFFNDEWFAAADSGNHRILLWRGLPESDGAEADVVLGQPDFTSEGPKLLHLPTGVVIHENRLLVADAWHHRILVWNRIPDRSGTLPDYAIGQPGINATEINRGGAHPSALSLYWPYGMGFAAGWFWVADTGNRRVLGWPAIPGPDQPARVILGQPAPDWGKENRGGPVCGRSFRWPHAIAGDDRRLFIADAGNHRVLCWSQVPNRDCDATGVLGQPGFSTAFELPHVPQGPARLRFPYGAALEEDTLAVADTANNRILIWEPAPDSASGPPATRVLGQDNFDAGGENRWTAVTPDSTCWPYAICLHRGRLAIADSGNNRVTVWDLSAARAPQPLKGGTVCA